MSVSTQWLDARRSNALAPINSLPPELLCEIFIFAVNAQAYGDPAEDSFILSHDQPHTDARAPEFSFFLSQVCSYWRNIALSPGCRSLWIYASINNFFGRRDLKKEQLSTWLSRSGEDTPLNLRLNLEEGELSPVVLRGITTREFSFGDLGLHHRIGTLDITIRTFPIETFLRSSLRTVFPNLTVLHVCFYDNVSTWTMSWSLPSLQVFRFRDRRRERVGSIPLSLMPDGLQEIDVEGGFLTIEPFFHFLIRCELLAKLAVRGVALVSRRPPEPIHHNTFPNIKNLYIGPNSFGRGSKSPLLLFLLVIHFPNIRSLTLHLERLKPEQSDVSKFVSYLPSLEIFILELKRQ